MSGVVLVCVVEVLSSNSASSEIFTTSIAQMNYYISL